MSQHTPGPWEIAPGNFIVADCRVKGHPETGCVVAEIPCQGGNSADLSLIAAAPELYQALIDVCDILCDYQAYSQTMRKIGRGFSTTDRIGRTDDNVLLAARALLVKVEGK
mgnify:FL=1